MTQDPSILFDFVALWFRLEYYTTFAHIFVLIYILYELALVAELQNHSADLSRENDVDLFYHFYRLGINMYT